MDDYSNNNIHHDDDSSSRPEEKDDDEEGNVAKSTTRMGGRQNHDRQIQWSSQRHRRSTHVGKQQRKNKKVHFLPWVEMKDTLSVDQYTEDEFKTTWYMTCEYRQFKANCRDDVRLYTSCLEHQNAVHQCSLGGTLTTANDDSTNNTNPNTGACTCISHTSTTDPTMPITITDKVLDAICLQGLEWCQTKNGGAIGRKQRRERVWAAVFTEQEQQDMAGCQDPTMLAQVSRRYSLPSQTAARLLGLEHQHLARSDANSYYMSCTTAIMTERSPASSSTNDEHLHTSSSSRGNQNRKMKAGQGQVRMALAILEQSSEQRWSTSSPPISPSRRAAKIPGTGDSPLVCYKRKRPVTK